METDRSRGHPAADLKNSALKHLKEKGHDPWTAGSCYMLKEARSLLKEDSSANTLVFGFDPLKVFHPLRSRTVR